MAGGTGLLSQKTELLRQILAETERQGRLIAESDLDGLCASLEARQAMMDAMDALDSEAGPAGQKAGPQGDIAALLRQIAATDRANREQAAGLARSLAEGFREVGAQRSVMAYVQPGGTGGRFVDKEG